MTTREQERAGRVAVLSRARRAQDTGVGLRAALDRPAGQEWQAQAHASRRSARRRVREDVGRVRPDACHSAQDDRRGAFLHLAGSTLPEADGLERSRQHGGRATRAWGRCGAYGARTACEGSFAAPCRPRCETHLAPGSSCSSTTARPRSCPRPRRHPRAAAQDKRAWAAAPLARRRARSRPCSRRRLM